MSISRQVKKWWQGMVGGAGISIIEKVQYVDITIPAGQNVASQTIDAVDQDNTVLILMGRTSDLTVNQPGSFYTFLNLLNATTVRGHRNAQSNGNARVTGCVVEFKPGALIKCQATSGNLNGTANGFAGLDEKYIIDNATFSYNGHYYDNNTAAPQSEEGGSNGINISGSTLLVNRPGGGTTSVVNVRLSVMEFNPSILAQPGVQTNQDISSGGTEASQSLSGKPLQDLMLFYGGRGVAVATASRQDYSPYVFIDPNTDSLVARRHSAPAGVSRIYSRLVQFVPGVIKRSSRGVLTIPAGQSQVATPVNLTGWDLSKTVVTWLGDTYQSAAAAASIAITRSRLDVDNSLGYPALFARRHSGTSAQPLLVSYEAIEFN